MTEDKRLSSVLKSFVLRWCYLDWKKRLTWSRRVFTFGNKQTVLFSSSWRFCVIINWAVSVKGRLHFIIILSITEFHWHGWYSGTPPYNESPPNIFLLISPVNATIFLWPVGDHMNGVPLALMFLQFMFFKYSSSTTSRLRLAIINRAKIENWGFRASTWYHPGEGCCFQSHFHQLLTEKWMVYQFLIQIGLTKNQVVWCSLTIWGCHGFCLLHCCRQSIRDFGLFWSPTSNEFKESSRKK